MGISEEERMIRASRRLSTGATHELAPLRLIS